MANPEWALRPQAADDEPFLFELYASTRRDEIAAWGWNEGQEEAFLRLQYQAQSAHFQGQYSGANFDIILKGGKPIGRLIVHRREDEIRAVDIALLPEYRGQGIGTSIFAELQAEAGRERRPLRLHVARQNQAQRLYERLGFRRTGEGDLYFSMEWP